MNMSTAEACEVIQKVRGDAIVVCTMGAMNALDKISTDPLNVACVPLMGGAASLGLGLALAQPKRPVFVLDGDASLLMELGGLVTVAQAAPGKYVHFLFNNSTQFSGLGNLDTPGAETVDFVGLARSAGYKTSQRICDLEDLERKLHSILSGPAPAFVELVVTKEAPTLGTTKPSVEMTDARFTRMGDELRRIRSHLV
ncbi:thiamine pyrophosphate-dependent enzyme [Cupriavidus taiwanensis]|uniref:Phosphonopyruvate decarboxylase n=2 Tax=Cupriavidus TaxID=106589 RepID=A0A0C4YK45_9BURK|nr:MULTISPECIES: thiamine pyrophosphate-dependent enzyme [Cupriavidus]AJG23448.1 Phosphonopyruvate decarboxylase [Cupriavidus basilensis]AZG14500.1 thiamine pyrophosphate-binding protein [Cupriavidus pauculus]MBY4732193.1 thiamine pyrophosphate-binding protein [Cupriavidus pauculus]MDK3024202.1 thiamine pyrophosphate-dependent enzyme [Cupriavidus taiwanensis]